MFASETHASATLARKVGACLLPALLGLGGALALLLLFSGPARPAKAAPAADTYPGPCGSTIQACLDNAAVGGTVLISPGTYVTSLTLSQAVNLTGVNSATTILQALSGQRVLTVTGVDVDSSVVISGLTFSGGSALGGSCPAGCGGGILITNQAEPRLQDLTVVSNSAGFAGGGVYAAGPLSLTGSAFQGNQCAPYPCDGGAVNAAGPLTVSGSRFISNTSETNGGAVYGASPLTVTNTLFQENTCLDDFCGGGGLFLASTGNTAYVAASQFLSNTAGGRGGGAWFDGNATIQGGTFQGNQCIMPLLIFHGCAGGGLFALTSLTVNGTHFLSNTAGVGAGAFANGAASVHDALFQGNQSNGFGDLFGGVATGSGGGLYDQDLLVLGNTRFFSNTSTSHGGGLYAAGAVFSSLTGSRFEGNSCSQAGCLGGGAYGASILDLTNGVFISNTAQSNGGGIYANAQTVLTGMRLEDNRCAETGCSGGGLYANDTLSMTGTQVLSNVSQGSGGGAYVGGAATLIGGLFQANQCLVGGCTGGGLRAASTLTVNGTHFLGNAAQAGGGGAYATGLATVHGALFQDNRCGQAGCLGGGLYAKNGLGLFTSLFLGNSAQAKGGGLAQVGGPGQVANTLFARNNTLDGGGEALYLASPGSVAILHTTIASPTLASGPAIVIITGTVGVTDTVITSYTTGISQTAGAVKEDYNLFFNVPVSVTAGVGGGTHSLTGNPLFVNSSTDNEHLSSGSAALDTGTNAGIATDIDGDPRPRGAGFDIGYDEARSPSAVGDSFSTAYNTALVVSAPGVLSNDSTLNAGPLAAVLVTAPATGTLVLAPSGAFTYTPPLNFTGQTSFVYRADDGQFTSAPTLVTITVNAFKLYLPLVQR